jgi:indole-3-glycerol phosphate synthase/phosphoribosylanthranilate isomerase
MADTILDQLANYARYRVREAEKKVPLEEVRRRAEEAAKNTPEERKFLFEKNISGDGMHLICECKKASPSKGLISPDFPYLKIARNYEEGGASAISCLTEPKWFLGKKEYLKEIAESVSLPVLRKDFTVDSYMIYETKTLGASAVLLICSLLSEETLREWIGICDSLGLSALVEAHDEREVEMAGRAGARVIGVNNRNLKDFTVDIHNAGRLRKYAPEQAIFVAESGIHKREDVKALEADKVHAALIGEQLMRAKDQKEEIRKLLGPTLQHESGQADLSPADGRPEENQDIDQKEKEAVNPKQDFRRDQTEKVKNPTKIKICGMQRPSDIEAVNEVLPDWAGFIFVPGRRRYVTYEKAKELIAGLDRRIEAVGVFVNAGTAEIRKAVQETGIRTVQLHGQETEEDIKELRASIPGIRIIKAFRIEKVEDIEAAEKSSADLVLLDHGPGGTGQGFNWSLVKSMKRPFLLAGGLDSENVDRAIESLHPYGVDASSSLETDGKKDPDKIRSFAEAVRNAKNRVEQLPDVRN